MHTRSRSRSLVRALLILLALAAVLAAGHPAALASPPGPSCPSSATLYVNASVSGGTGDGSTWANATASLWAALTTAASCSNVTQIWVAAGTYKPTAGTDRSATFALKNNLAIYGGFAGSETQLSQRNWRTNVTILSGDIGTANDTSDNSYHVVTGSGTDGTAVLDGFTVTGGNGDYGGGMYNSGGSPSLSNLIFSGNSASSSGGGMYNSGSSPTLTNVVFSGNSAGLSGGGGIGNFQSSPTLTNVTFSGNSTSFSGGGMYNASTSSPKIRNSILWGDTPDEINGGSSSHPSVSNSIVQGSSDTSNGNLNSDPLFVGPPGNLRLQYASPAINKGSNSVTDPSLPPTDLDGAPRIQGGTVDMGAYESPCPAQGSIIYVNASVSGGLGDGSSWLNAYTTLTAALAGVPTTPANACAEIWVAAGTYKPTTDTNPYATFQLQNNVAVYGGFAGTETTSQFSLRNWRTNVTILSGDIGTANNSSDNSYHVVTGSGTNSSAILDGFKITAGNAQYNQVSGTSYFGGGMYNKNGSPTLANLTVSGNSALYGGGIYNEGSSPTLTNVTVSGNSVSDYGGGMYNYGNSSPTLTNVTFSGNSSGSYGSGMANNSGSNPTIRNSILWGDRGGIEIANLYQSAATVAYSIVQGGYTGATNSDPLFITPITASAPTTTGNLRLQSGSPAIDAGNNILIPPGVTTDLDDAPRIAFSIVDMGAYEAQVVASPTQSPAANSAGWNNADVTVTWNWRNASGAVPDSVDCPATSTSSGEGTITLKTTCKDANGYTGAASYTVKVDKTPPTVNTNPTANSCDVPGNTPWCRGTQTAGFTASDSLSGVASPCTGASCNFTQSTTTNGSGVTIPSGQVCDVAGNCAASINSAPFSIDSVAPTNVSGAPTTPPNGSNGWYTSQLQVQFSGSDPSPGSGIASCSLVTYSGPDGAAVTVNGSCTDYAGNTSASVASSTFKYDATPPTLNPTISPNPPVLGGAATASPNASDATSGVTTQSCDPVNTSSIGPKTLTCTATDNAGNTSSVQVNYTVGYGVSTVSPTVGPPSVNSLYPLSIGTTATPIKWVLKNAAGQAITAAGSVTGVAYKLNSSAASCNSFTTDATGATAASVTSANPKYDTLQKLWVYNWVLPGRGCYTLFVTLNTSQVIPLFYHIY
ncbi:MAG: choice-of-anchor Q domain-containing protein [Anaerolineae bacterium]